MTRKVAQEFGGKIRIRACGICIKGDSLLLANHFGVYNHDFWAPPGGGVNFGESIEMALKREFKEECRVDVQVGKFLFGSEFIQSPYHALELFFEVNTNQEPSLGNDPEIVDHQVISEIKFLPWDLILNLPEKHRHGMFKTANKITQLIQMRGFYDFT